jgi:hypothetical protein
VNGKWWDGSVITPHRVDFSYFFSFLVSQTVSHHLRVGGQSESIKSGLRYKSYYIRGYRPLLCSYKLMDDEK